MNSIITLFFVVVAFVAMAFDGLLCPIQKGLFPFKQQVEYYHRDQFLSLAISTNLVN